MTFEDPGDLESFKRSYREALLKNIAIYDNLYLCEERQYVGKPGDELYLLSGGACGDYIKSSLKPGGRPKLQSLLSSRSRLAVFQNEKTKEWSLHEYIHVRDKQTYEFQRKMVKFHFPESFTFPFADRNGWVSVQDILEGKSANYKLRNNTVKMNKITIVKSGIMPAYRIDFTLSADEQKETFSGHYVVVPELSWMITGGRIRMEEWDIEYGDRIDGVPVVKKVVMKNSGATDETKVSTVQPVYIITVTKAEKYTTVNPEEFEPSYYGIQISQEPFQPDRPTPVPPILYVAGLGMICFITGILLLHRARRRRSTQFENHLVGNTAPPTSA